jgi:hypothetical protein
MGNELKNKILIQNGIISEIDQKKPVILSCPRCEVTNAIENKYCSKCSYPLKPEAYDEIKKSEEVRINILEQKYEKEIQLLKEDMNAKFNQVLSVIQQNPILAKVKSEIITAKFAATKT